MYGESYNRNDTILSSSIREQCDFPLTSYRREGENNNVNLYKLVDAPLSGADRITEVLHRMLLNQSHRGLHLGMHSGGVQGTLT